MDRRGVIVVVLMTVALAAAIVSANLFAGRWSNETSKSTGRGSARPARTTFVKASAGDSKSWKPAPGALRVAVWAWPAANSDKIVATMRALQACGFDCTGIGWNNLMNNQLTRANFDVLVLPAGREDSVSAYTDS